MTLTLPAQGQRKAKLLGFIFSHTFQLIKMKCDTIMKQFKLNMSILLSVRFNERREITAVLLTFKNFSVDIWFRTFVYLFGSKLVL